MSLRDKESGRMGVRQVKAAGRGAQRRDRRGDAKPSRYASRRAAMLIVVYVLMVAHVVHWKLAGHAIAPASASGPSQLPFASMVPLTVTV